MKIIQAIILIFVILYSTQIKGQNEKTVKYSIARSAIIIDSLENRLESSSNSENADLLFELAILYRQIDSNQSKKYAFKYLSINDSISSVNKRNIIYGFLAHTYEQQGNIDSSYYFLSLQSTLIDELYKERGKILKEKYLGSIISQDYNSNNEIFGLSKSQYLSIFGLVILLAGGLVYFFISKWKFKKTEAESNKKLEIANTKLSKFNEKLERAVNDKTKNEEAALEKSTNAIVGLRKSLKKSEESNYLKNAFLGSMSHQIRTPLSGIMGFSDLLEVELAVMGNEDLYEYAKNIRESGEKLMSLITNIIDISSIEANILDYNISSCDLNKIFKEVENNYLFKAKEKGLVYKTKLDNDLPKIVADTGSLVKALNVIMDNAVKYTEKGFVTISTIHNVNNNTATIEIKDKGIGISEKTLNMLYASFEYKKHGSSLTYQGQGLGLILAHRLIDLMNSKLEITSQLGVGTNVKITLPCTSETDNIDISDNISQKKASIISAPEYGRIKIFIVEDDRMNRLVLEKMLKKTGEITTAIDGKDTLKIIEKSSKSNKIFDVMLFDINLPEPWDGIKLMHEVKKKFPIYKNVPFIAQTAYAMMGDKDSYLEAGFNDYIAKPIIKTELLTMIQKQFDLYKVGPKTEYTTNK